MAWQTKFLKNQHDSLWSNIGRVTKPLKFLKREVGSGSHRPGCDVKIHEEKKKGMEVVVGGRKQKLEGKHGG